MSEGVRYPVVAEYSVRDMATSPLGRIAHAAAGVGAASAGALQQIANLGLAFQTLRGVGGAVFGAISTSVIKLNSDFQNTQLAVAGVLKAYGMVDTFEDGAKAATVAFDIIRKKAAVLPGEADDYVNVWRTGLAGLAKSGLRDTAKMADYVSDFTAAAITMQIDAPQAGRDLSMMLAGRASNLVKSWTTFSALIGKSGQEFNKLSAEERRLELGKAISKYKPMLNQFVNTWDAQKGTTIAFVKEITRALTGPLYTSFIGGMVKMNAWLGKNEELVQRLARGMGVVLAEGINTAVKAAQRLHTTLQPVLQGIKSMAGSAIDSVRSGISSMGGGDLAHTGIGALAGRRAMAMGLGTTAGAAVGLGVGGLIKGYTMQSEGDVGGNRKQMTNDAAAGGFGNLLRALGPLISIIDTITTAIGNLLVLAFTPIAEVFQMITEFGLRVLQGFAELAMFVGEALAPILRVVGDTLGWLAKTIGRLIMVPMRFLWGAIELIIWAFGTLLKPIAVGLAFVFEALMLPIKALIDFILDFLEKIGKGFMGKAWSPNKAEEPAPLEMPDLFKRFMDAGEKQGDAANTLLNPAKLPGGPKAVTNNDFRGSKFDIKQAFAPGFDPERIALAFSSDLASLAEHKVQSGYSPLFTAR